MKASGIKQLIGLVMFCAVGIFLTSLWSRSTPLPAFNEALAAYKGQTPLVLGGRDRFAGGESYHRRNYVLLLSFKFVVVTQRGNEPPVVREETGGFVLFVFIVMAALLWEWWRRSGKAEEEGG
ncbi:hypothetical protein KK141_09205 [Dyella sp. LX-66]|uniref:hypothetical protein n=1 Tax=unclassified Dyella TaxID=2634549 RepID=UPI001BDFC39B|nr:MULTISPECIES: hypothetical protein [unclassified Dyella]MBT2115895.1 hypothetical protein [Dyella sp. LX-1]MBT2139710.1 hypothetical protein [Dyella sp. LX-66]